MPILRLVPTLPISGGGLSDSSFFLGGMMDYSHAAVEKYSLDNYIKIA